MRHYLKINKSKSCTQKSSLPVDCLRKFAMGDNTCNFWCGQCNDTMHNTFFRITGPIPNFSKKSISLEPLYKSKNDFWSFSCIMVALKSERKRSLLITMAIRATAILKFTTHFWGAWKQIGLFQSAASPLRAQIVTVFVRFRRHFCVQFVAWNVCVFWAWNEESERQNVDQLPFRLR